jgi:Holliday junction DNA helicase RuvA
MIGYLRGVVLYERVATTSPTIIDVGGVGYNVFVASVSPLGIGSEVALFVHTVVRPDALILYGFVSVEDRTLFETLLATPGVGPATALAALRTVGAIALLTAIEAGDVKTVATIPGVGAKTASRIVLELKGKLVLPEVTATVPTSPRGSDIEEALRGWGYSATEIRDALRDVSLPDDESEALKLALRLLRRS